ncbi:CLUMA_CG009979, isoform A [Clunio marinus]|uniref:CLUMA_CG009979, isoform A n=1 Tax=Clunio marinus TaxID=568069 RepID=A0A1J1I905_9DIPT|nr:CLUMA_CG009979, isoform A [Clunio marinus]
MVKRPVKKPSKFRQLTPVIKTIFLAAFVAYISIFVADFVTKYSIQIKPRNETMNVANSTVNATETAAVVHVAGPRKPKYWFYMAKGYMWIFFSVDNVLKKLGLEKIEVDVNRHRAVHMDWDLLWTYDYHSEINIDFKKLKYHQKINHIPGNYVLCMKDYLAVNTKSKYIAPAFNNSESLEEYANEHPNARFVQKLWSNRGVSLKNASEINFKMFGSGYKYFAQLYIENPLLIDGYKFDFGIYVLVASLEPLRVYFYEKNTLIRLCGKKYDPNNYEDLDTYVIGDVCQFPWDIDVLSVYYNQSYTYKEAMNAYFTKNGYNVSKIWWQVEDCIREIILNSESSFNHWVKQYPFKYSFFELYRFDFMLDNDLNLYLLEVNQSPNVNPSVRLARDRRMFENLLFDSFTLLGVGSYIKNKTNFEFGGDLEEQMICHRDSITVRPETCVNKPCNETCDPEECDLCWDCLSNNQRHDLHLAYREAKHRGTMKRIFPPPKVCLSSFGETWRKIPEGSYASQCSTHKVVPGNV